MKGTVKKIFDGVLDVLIILVLLVSVAVIISSTASRKTGVPSILGTAFFSVRTDSMEPTIRVGDLIVGHVSGADAEYEEGDVVTFWTTVENTRITITHRIIKVEEVDGLRYYTTRGDNTVSQDSRQIVAGDIIAQWTGTRLGKVGTVLDFLKTQKGFFLCILLPMALFFLYMLYNFIRNLSAYNREKAVEAAKEAAAAVATELTEEQKRKAIEEYLASQKNSEQSSDKES